MAVGVVAVVAGPVTVIVLLGGVRHERAVVLAVDEAIAVSDAATYAARIDAYLADPRFARRIQSYFQDTMKLGGGADGDADGQLE